MKRILYTAGIILLLIFLLHHPAEALGAARDGMDLWLNTLIPTLLPFMILTDLLIRTGTAENLLMPLKGFWKKAFGISPSGAYVLIFGLLCGYPMGARITSDMYGHHKISKREAEYLLTFTNHASPVFIYTYILHLCFRDQIPSWMVFGILFLSSILTMLFFRFCIYRGRTVSVLENEKKESSAPGVTGTLLDASIMNGFETITRLGGYILLFSILSALIRHYWKAGAVAGYLFLGFLELTTGLHFLTGSGLPLTVRYLCAMPMAAFGGVCILAQTKSILHRELSVLPYFSAKCLNATITAVIALFLVQII